MPPAHRADDDMRGENQADRRSERAELSSTLASQASVHILGVRISWSMSDGDHEGIAHSSSRAEVQLQKKNASIA